MITVTVKTLAGADHQFEVSESSTVKQFKETISGGVQVPVERQRLIFQGRVLQDTQVLGDIGVDNRTVHLVERLPGIPASGSAGSSPLFRRRGDANAQSAGRAVGEMGQQQMVMGAVALPSGELTREQITGCLRRILNRVGEIGRRAELETRETQDGSLIQADIRLRSHSPRDSSSQTGVHIDGPATQRVEHIRHILKHINHILNHLENDTGDETEEQSPDASALGDPFHGCCTEGNGNSTQQREDTQSDASADGYYQLETDTINGEEVSVRQTRVSALATLLDDILRIEERMRPHLARYQSMLRQDEEYTGERETDGQRASRFFNNIQTILHNLAHVYHSYSDLNIHFCQRPPRYLYPQLVGQRAAPQGQGSLQRSTTTVQTTAEVQITMNFQRGGDQEGQAEPRPQPIPPPVFVGTPPFPSIRVEGSAGNNAAYTSVDISPNTVTINQVTARIEGGQPQTAPAPPQPSSGASQQRQPTPFPGMPANFLQQLVQGIAGRAATGIVAGNVNFGQNMAAPRPRMAAQQRPDAGTPRPPSGVRFRMPAPQQLVPGQLRPVAMQPQNLVFTAAPYSVQGSAQPAIFVGNEPPAVLPLYTFDEYLPCASRHFDPRQRPSVSNRPSRQSQREQTAATAAAASAEQGNAEPTENANISDLESDFEQHLEPIVRSVVASLRDSVTRHPGSDGAGQEGMWHFIPVFTGAQGAAGPGAGARLTPAAAMRRPSSDPNIFQRNRRASNSHRDVIEGMVRGVYSNMMGNSRETLGDYMRSLGQESERSDSVLMEMLQTVMLSLSFSDIWALFANDSRPLDRSRSVLRRHFVENLLNGNESPSEDDLRSAANRAASLDRSVWQELTAEMESDDLDFAATMVKCEEAFLLDVLMMVFGYSFNPSEDFGRRIYDRAWLYAREAVTAALICCANGEQGFEQFANRVVANTMRQVSEEFRQPFAAAGVQHLRTLYTQHRLERAAVEQYLVKKSAAAETATAATNEVPKAAPDQTTADNKDEAPMASSQTGMPKKEGGEEEWKRHLPSEWVHVMEVDVERQRNQPPQKPFSDAYINGMPSKRRKLLYDQRPRAILNAAATSTDAFLKEALRQSIVDAGVSPVTGEQVEDVLDNISVDSNGPELASAFAHNVEQRFTNRLRSEQVANDEKGQIEGRDFDPSRYPNATERFLKP